MEKRLFLFLAAFLVSMQIAFAQGGAVKGNVTDKSGEAIIGATVKVDGTNVATVTDIDGNFNLKVAPGANITVSYVGMKDYTGKTANNMKIVLQEAVKGLEEVVVIGYGSAKAKDLTSPITVVKAADIASTPSSSPMTALQGKVAGVNVVSNGTPGAGPTVRIRGAGSFANSSPLYVVDGMFYDDINFLNNEDIQDMSILKDASAAAIYGVRAANGVVIITTKKGAKNQAAKITYDGYVGVQMATNVIDMASSKEYSDMLLEADYNSYSQVLKNSIDRFGGSYADADFHNWKYDTDTDWYDELLRKAIITNHSVNISGGSDKTTYSIGGSYLYQNGIMNVDNDYNRLNFRASIDSDVTNWLKVGFSGVYSRSTQKLPKNAAWQYAFINPGIYPVIDENNDRSFPKRYGSAETIGLSRNFQNPVALAELYDNENKVKQYMTNFYAQFNIIPSKLNFKTSISFDTRDIDGTEFTPTHYVLAEAQEANKTRLHKEVTSYDNKIWDNTLTYKDSYKEHSFGAMAGFSMREENYRKMWGEAVNVPEGKKEYHYLTQGDAEGVKLGDEGTTYRGLSYFGRLNYSYANKYYLMFTMRADGSSKYQEQWGYFPSVGASWVISEEPWMKSVKAIDYLKLRASWGKLGNDHVAASDGFASISTGNGSSGVFGGSTFPGYQNSSYFSWLQWEVVDEFNAGFNLVTLSNRLSVDVDYFHRMTNHAVISPRVPFGTEALAGNYGKILNQGVDFSATWSDKIGNDFKYNIGLNMSFLNNEVKELGGKSIIFEGFTVNKVGENMNSFYGYEVEGIYQTPEECAADRTAVLNGLEPGDFRYKDLNGDGIIDGNDRTTLGSYIPTLTFGLNFGFEYKNFDFNLSTYGQAGAEMMNRKRGMRYMDSYQNFDKDIVDNRWTGPGSTNEYPSAKALTKGWNVSDQRVNSFYIEDASYFRIQNVTLGYTFKDINCGSYTLPRLRMSLTADRPLTLFGANSLTPELSDPRGVDFDLYPITATYTFGVQLTF